MISDSDNSRQITYDEFVTWARSNVKVMSLIETLSKISAEVTVNVEEEDEAEEVVDEDLSSILDQERTKIDCSLLTEEVNTVNHAHVKAIIDEMKDEIENNNSNNSADWSDSQQTLNSMLTNSSQDMPNYSNSPSLPPTNLTIDCIHGYNSASSRQVSVVVVAPFPHPII